MLNITIYDVIEQHICNDNRRERMKSYSMKQTTELEDAPGGFEKISQLHGSRKRPY
jgi:hypothetical protein